jgi:carboxypeptidase family protein
MTRLPLPLALAFAVLALTACHPGPVVGPGGRPDAPGTIAGIVTFEGNAPVAGRKVTVINTTTAAKFEATTAANGGYTIQVPHGTYKIDVELQPGERVVRQPPPTKIDKSDLDPHRDIVISQR